MNCDIVKDFPNDVNVWCAAINENMKLFVEFNVITETEHCYLLYRGIEVLRELCLLKGWAARRVKLYSELTERYASIIEYACLIYFLSPESLADYCMFVRHFYSSGNKKKSITSLRIKCNYVRDIPIYVQVWESELIEYLSCPILSEQKQSDQVQKRINAMRTLMQYLSLNCQMPTALQSKAPSDQ